MKQQFIDRLKENYSEYRIELLHKDRQELIDDAARIAAVNTVFLYMTQEYHFEDSELKFLMQFQNPLKVLTEHWIKEEKDSDSNKFKAAFHSNLICKDDLRNYPIITFTEMEVEPKEILHKFMNVDILCFVKATVKKIAGSSIFDNDVELLKNTVSTKSGKNSLLLLCTEGFYSLRSERDTLIRGTSSYEDISILLSYSKNTKGVIYSIDITRNQNGIYGNIYERSLNQYCEFIQTNAVPYIATTYIHEDGYQICIPSSNSFYNYSRAEKEHGKVIIWHDETEDESVLNGILNQEHDKRDKITESCFKEYIQELSDQLINQEVERLKVILLKLKRPNSPDKSCMIAEVSRYFIYRADDQDIENLVLKLKKELHNEIISVNNLKKRKYIFMCPDSTLGFEAPLSSIRKQINVKVEKKPSVKQKNREAR